MCTLRYPRRPDVATATIRAAVTAAAVMAVTAVAAMASWALPRGGDGGGGA